MSADASPGSVDRSASTGATSRDEALRDQLRALTGNGRPPDLVELRQFLRDHKVSPRELERLIANPTLGPAQLADATTAHPTPVTPRPASTPRPPTAGHPPGPTGADWIARRSPPEQHPAAPSPPPGPTGRVEADATMDEDLWDDFDDPFALDAPPKAPRSPTTGDEPPQTGGPDPVPKLVADLLDDYARSGRVERGTAVALAARRGIDVHQLERALGQLEQAGVELDEDPVETAYDGARDLDGGKTRRLAGSEVLDQLSDYFARAGRIPLIGADVEVRLGAAITAGQRADEALADPEDLTAAEIVRLRELSRAGRDAHADLVRANLRLVVSIARHRQYTDCGVELSDRIQDGNIGLLRAADKFDSTLGFKFSTYATWWIRQSIERGAGDRGRLIRVPVHMHEKLQKLHRVRRVLEAQLGRDATIPEIAAELGEEPDKVAETVGYLHAVISLDAPIGEDDATLSDLLSAEADIDGRDDPVEIVLAADFHRRFDDTLWLALTEREHRIITQRFGLKDQDPLTLDAIGAELGVTRERIRQIQTKTLVKLRAHAGTALLFEYLTGTAPNAPKPLPSKQARPGGDPASVDLPADDPSSEDTPLSDPSATLPR